MSSLSLGYQTTLAWTTDLAWRLLRRYPGSEDPLAEPAVVLVDEIDLHLHPRWQLRIIDDLSEIFKKTQFVATAHSPLIVQVAQAANLVLLRKRESDVEIVNDPEVVRSWRVDQILTSELFDVPRSRDEQTERLFKRRDELIDNPSRSAAEESELERIRIQISKLPTAQDPRDQEAMDFIRRAAAILKKQVVEQ
jgi:predicted ATP-binding protein involved in virulence